MPSVPRYDSLKIELNPLPSGKAESVITPGLIGEPARQAQDLGRNLTQAGAGLVDIQLHMQEREDADSVFRAETAIKDEYLGFEQEQRKRQGRFAKGATEETEKWFKERIEHHAKNLGNDRQRRVFGQRSTALRLHATDATSKWEAVNLEKSHDESWSADKKVTISVAAAAATPDAIDRARMELERLNRYQAARKGWEAAQLTAETLRDKTELHKQVLQGLAEKNPIAAAAYFAKYKDEIDGTLHAELSDFSKKVSAAALAEATVAEVWATMGPKNDRVPLELDKLEEKLRAELKGNEPAIEAAIKRVRERATAFKDARRERDDALEASVNQAILDGAPRAQVVRMPAFLQLSPEAARKIDTFLENRAYTAEARAAAREQRLDAAESRRQRALHRDSLSTALALSDPDELAKLTRNQVANLLPVLGEESTRNLLARYDSISKNPEKLTEARMDRDDFNTVALELGLRPNEKNKSEAEKDQLVRLQSHVENVIGAEQAARKRPLTREEKMKIMRSEMDNKVIVDRWWPIPDQSKPLAILQPDQLQDAYVMVDGTRVQLSSIPREARAEIIAARRKRNLPLTEEGIARTWLRARPRSAPAQPAASRWIDSTMEYVGKGGRAAASALPAANAAVLGVEEAVAETLARLPATTALDLVVKTAASSSLPDIQRMRHEQEAVAKDWMPRGTSVVEQGVYGGLQSTGQALFTLPLSMLTGMAQPALLAMSSLTFGRAFGEARDAQVVPKAARAQIEAALEKSKMPVTEDNVRRLYDLYLEVRRAKELDAPQP